MYQVIQYILCTVHLYVHTAVRVAHHPLFLVLQPVPDTPISFLLNFATGM